MLCLLAALSCSLQVLRASWWELHDDVSETPWWRWWGWYRQAIWLVTTWRNVTEMFFHDDGPSKRLWCYWVITNPHRDNKTSSGKPTRREERKESIWNETFSKHGHVMFRGAHTFGRIGLCVCVCVEAMAVQTNEWMSQLWFVNLFILNMTRCFVRIPRESERDASIHPITQYKENQLILDLFQWVFN